MGLEPPTKCVNYGGNERALQGVGVTATAPTLGSRVEVSGTNDINIATALLRNAVIMLLMALRVSAAVCRTATADS